MSLRSYPLGTEIALASGMTGVSGGAFISWGAYEKTADITQALSTYQYMHRLIGYYAERAGYKSSQLDLLKRLPMEHDFFLSHAMTDTSYVKLWRLFVPNGF